MLEFLAKASATGRSKMSDRGRSRSKPLSFRAHWQSIAGESRTRRPLAGLVSGITGNPAGVDGVRRSRGEGRPDYSVSVTAARPQRPVAWFDWWVAQSMPVGAVALNIGAPTGPVI